jgi:hypothetical protein
LLWGCGDGFSVECFYALDVFGHGGSFEAEALDHMLDVVGVVVCEFYFEYDGDLGEDVPEGALVPEFMVVLACGDAA